jgi:hypothetical protein
LVSPGATIENTVLSITPDSEDHDQNTIKSCQGLVKDRRNQQKTSSSFDDRSTESNCLPIPDVVSHQNDQAISRFDLSDRSNQFFDIALTITEELFKEITFLFNDSRFFRD